MGCSYDPLLSVSSLFVGMYCTGWVNTGPVGVILTTMTQAFDTGKIVVKDIDDGRLDTNKPGRETINRILNNKGLENILLSPRQRSCNGI